MTVLILVACGGLCLAFLAGDAVGRKRAEAAAREAHILRRLWNGR